MVIKVDVEQNSMVSQDNTAKLLDIETEFYYSMHKNRVGAQLRHILQFFLFAATTTTDIAPKRLQSAKLSGQMPVKCPSMA